MRDPMRNRKLLNMARIFVFAVVVICLFTLPKKITLPDNINEVIIILPSGERIKHNSAEKIDAIRSLLDGCIIVRTPQNGFTLQSAGAFAVDIILLTENSKEVKYTIHQRWIQTENGKWYEMPSSKESKFQKLFSDVLSE